MWNCCGGEQLLRGVCECKHDDRSIEVQYTVLWKIDVVRAWEARSRFLEAPAAELAVRSQRLGSRPGLVENQPHAPIQIIEQGDRAPIVFLYAKRDQCRLATSITHL